MNWFFRLLAKISGKNCSHTPLAVIKDQMLEPRPLPMGRTEFEDWSDRIISGALLPGGKEDQAVFIDSQRFSLCEMIMHLGPTESHKPDAYFIHSLRKAAVNQVAHTRMCEIRDAAKARLALEEAAKKEEEARIKAEEGIDEHEDCQQIAQALSGSVAPESSKLRVDRSSLEAGAQGPCGAP